MTRLRQKNPRPQLLRGEGCTSKRWSRLSLKKKKRNLLILRIRHRPIRHLSLRSGSSSRPSRIRSNRQTHRGQTDRYLRHRNSRRRTDQYI